MLWSVRLPEVPVVALVRPAAPQHAPDPHAPRGDLRFALRLSTELDAADAATAAAVVAERARAHLGFARAAVEPEGVPLPGSTAPAWVEQDPAGGAAALVVHVRGTDKSFSIALHGPPDGLDPARALDVVDVAAEILAKSLHKKALEHRLREESRRLPRILDALPVAIYVADDHGRPVYANATATRLLGKEVEARGDGAESSLRVLGTDEPYPAERGPIARALQGESTVVVDMEVRGEGGSTPLEVHGAPVRGTDGRVENAVAVFVDATEKRAADRRLRDLASVVNSTDDAVVVKTPDGRVVAWNRGAERMFGFEALEIVGRPIRAIVPDDLVDEMHAIRARLLAGERIDHYETTRRRKDGKLIQVSLTESPLRDAADRVVGMSMIARDVSERAALRRQVELSSRMASLGSLSAGVAHEINNPLTFIIVNLGLLADELSARGVADDDDLRTLLRETVEGGERIKKVVRDLLTFARPPLDQPMPLDVRRAMDWALGVAAHEVKHCATVTRDLHEVPPVIADESRLGQVFLNLVVNAAQAFSDARVDDNRITVRTRLRRDGQVVVEVADNGCGMTPQVLERIWDPFFTTKPVGTGTGIGLPMCHDIVAKLGGRIEVESEAGKGTTVRVVLPAAAA
jgi:PAS domain S-box-containing protein